MFEVGIVLIPVFLSSTSTKLLESMRTTSEDEVSLFFKVALVHALAVLEPGFTLTLSMQFFSSPTARSVALILCALLSTAPIE